MGNSTSNSDLAAIAFLREKSVDKVPGIGKFKRWDPAAKARTLIVMEGDNTVPLESTKTDGEDEYETVQTITFISEFNKFCTRCPAWSHSGVTLFWKKYQNIEDLLVLRRQHSGLCFMHAPVTLQHYLVCISQGRKSDVGMTNIALYIKRYWKGKRLADYLVRDSGSDSYSFFEEINHEVPNLSENLERVHLNQVSSSFWDRILSEVAVKPILVSNFRVNKTFHESGEVSFSVVDNSDFVGLHAILLIGGRKDAAGDYFFLLQNWWLNRFFIEVSAKYLQKSGACLTIVLCDVDKIPKDYPILRDGYAETSADCSEKLDELWF
jgi:hypothetical protein